MVRAPCCEKMGLKKGPWTPEEDHVLVSYIQKYGHGNWRALPKLAGLLRCGKSCRLRWTNYLRPDIKRGNFSREEEDAIIGLHELLGNRWSAIAARLPGRTDNEIKNVWHTHLKKKKKNKLNFKQSVITTKVEEAQQGHNRQVSYEPELDASSCNAKSESFEHQCTTTTSSADEMGMKFDDHEVKLPETDEGFWSEVLFDQASGAVANIEVNANVDYGYNGSNMYDHCMDFWYNVFTGVGEIPELLEI